MEPLLRLETLLGGSWMTFLFVLGRVIGLVVAVSHGIPIAVPMQVRAAASVVLALALAPVVTAPGPDTLTALGVGLLGEVLTGLGLGLGVGLLFVGLQLAGALIGQITGLSLVETGDANEASRIPLLSHWFALLGVLLFLTLGGHRVLVEGLLESCRLISPGSGLAGQTILETALALLQASYLLALRVAAPTIITVVVCSVAVALLGRAAPALDLLATAAGGKVWLGLAATLLSCGTVAWLLPDSWGEMMDSLAKLTTRPAG